jgi:hypothetical protein
MNFFLSVILMPARPWSLTPHRELTVINIYGRQLEQANIQAQAEGLIRIFVGPSPPGY